MARDDVLELDLVFFYWTVLSLFNFSVFLFKCAVLFPNCLPCKFRLCLHNELRLSFLSLLFRHKEPNHNIASMIHF